MGQRLKDQKMLMLDLQKIKDLIRILNLNQTNAEALSAIISIQLNQDIINQSCDVTTPIIILL